MRPRMYGSSDRYECFTSTWPSASAGISVAMILKLSAEASPIGRDDSRTCLLVMMVAPGWRSVVLHVRPALLQRLGQCHEVGGDLLSQCGVAECEELADVPQVLRSAGIQFQEHEVARKHHPRSAGDCLGPGNRALAATGVCQQRHRLADRCR